MTLFNSNDYKNRNRIPVKAGDRYNIKIIMEAKRILFTEDDVAKLKGRWMEVCPPIVADKYWEVMNQRYREGQRHYHNFFHMRKLYTFFDEHVAPIIKQEIP
jgi:predicted metal-dependent HD superfamily phosphohydrolase